VDVDVQNDDITGLLAAWRNGDRAALGKLVPLVYDELRSLARRQLAGQDRRLLQTTALVHDAYLKLAGHSRLDVQDRRHFFAIAARAMRQLVVDQARRETARKRGGRATDLPLDEGRLALGERAGEIVAMDDALDRLAVVDERLSRVVELRFFGGLSVEETAEVLDSSPRTVTRDWRKARAFLHGELEKGGR
jgi:RNA polymerase sigma factor (TIGR02999 family)